MSPELHQLLWHEIPMLLGRLYLLLIALFVAALFIGPAIARLTRPRRRPLRLPDTHPYVRPHDRKDPHT